jgi:hypothetical protein
MKRLPARHVSHGAQCDQVASALVSSARRSCFTGVPSPARTTYKGGVWPEATGAEVWARLQGRACALDRPPPPGATPTSSAS